MELISVNFAYYIFLILLAALYGYGMYFWKKRVNWRLPLKTARRIKFIHYLGLGICLVAVILFERFGIRLKGLWAIQTILPRYTVNWDLFHFFSSISVIRQH